MCHIGTRWPHGGEKNTHHSRECWPRRVLCFQVISVYELGMCGVMTPLVATVECSIFGRSRLKKSAQGEKQVAMLSRLQGDRARHLVRPYVNFIPYLLLGERQVLLDRALFHCPVYFGL